MASVLSRINTDHTDSVNDVQVNYHGTRLATCSSDRLIKVFDLKPTGQSTLMAELAEHNGPVWKIAWAHPQFSNVFASAGYDKKVVVFSEENGRWKKIHEYTGHEASVNDAAFAPHQHGLVLATASADGTVAILTFNVLKTNYTTQIIHDAHDQGVNAVSWAPPIQLTAFEGSDVSIQKRIATGGNDKLIKIWVEGDIASGWHLERVLTAHTDFVRDVQWCPVVYHNSFTIASCGQDRCLLLWRSKGASDTEWTSKLLEKADGALWHVSWSLCGNILATTSEDNKIVLFKENLSGEWSHVEHDELQRQQQRH